MTHFHYRFTFWFIIAVSVLELSAETFEGYKHVHRIYNKHNINQTIQLDEDSENIIDQIKKQVEDGVKFMLYTRKNPMYFNNIYWENQDYISTLHFDPSRVTKVIIHGWLNSHNSSFPKLLKNAYLTRYDANVIVVDWRPMSMWFYPTARMAVPYVADKVANFLAVLVGSGVEPSKLHLVGHSLGAHLAGIAGLRSNFTLDRITGLDPASPMFSLDEEERLRNTSAKFVDVIHTCGLLLGFFSNIGHVDFYPNGGRPVQPGCGLDLDGECSHTRAHEYFIESVISQGSFIGVACNKWDTYLKKRCTPPKYAEMGEYATRSARGVYYLRTSAEEPYGLGRTEEL